jgi:hypothetical protein
MRAPARLIVGHLALLAFLCSLVVPSFAYGHLLLDDDPDCGSFVAVFRHASAIGNSVGTVPEHCAACHWLRSLRNTAPTPVARPTPGLYTTRAELPVQPNGVGHSPTFDTPSRAPPASSAA